MLNKVQVVCTIDDKYIQHCTVMLSSLFVNNGDMKFNIHLVSNDFSAYGFSVLRRFVEDYGHSFNTYQVDESLFKDAPLSNHVTAATYYRIYLTRILPSTIEKVLFLDPDLLVCDSIADLWNTNLEDYYIAASREFIGAGTRERLNLPDQYAYFNAGVMLLNLKLWRQTNMAAQVAEFINTYPEKLEYWDQDALNAVLYDKTVYLSSKWNVTQTYFYRSNYDQSGIPENEFTEAINNFKIIHFTGRSKPWQVNNRHPKRSLYYYYLAKVPAYFRRMQQKSLSSCYDDLAKEKFRSKKFMNGIVFLLKSWYEFPVAFWKII